MDRDKDGFPIIKNPKIADLCKRLKEELLPIQDLGERMEAMGVFIDKELKQMGIRDVEVDTKNMQIKYKREH